MSKQMKLLDYKDPAKIIDKAVEECNGGKHIVLPFTIEGNFKYENRRR